MLFRVVHIFMLWTELMYHLCNDVMQHEWRHVACQTHPSRPFLDRTLCEHSGALVRSASKKCTNFLAKFLVTHSSQGVQYWTANAHYPLAALCPCDWSHSGIFSTLQECHYHNPDNPVLLVLVTYHNACDGTHSRAFNAFRIWKNRVSIQSWEKKAIASNIRFNIRSFILSLASGIIFILFYTETKAAVWKEWHGNQRGKINDSKPDSEPEEVFELWPLAILNRLSFVQP